ncbi:MAG: (2Fe-2S)-binding protein [Lachnospiraceae bacterium]|nr:(2Fe-2S)-binding protein [Lachnospiraceae bacterium]
MRVVSHPVLGEMQDIEWVNIIVNGKPMKAKKGEMILAALLSEGIIVNRYTTKKHEPRGIFCGIGQCADCMMVVNTPVSGASSRVILQYFCFAKATFSGLTSFRYPLSENTIQFE